MSRLQNINENDLLPEREFTPDNVELFFYNAALWNAHRIHYDLPYATEVEGYPGLVIAGPQLGDWLTQTAIEWLGDDGRLCSFEYSNRKASYIRETLRSGGKVISVDRSSGDVVLELFIKNADDEIITPGAANLRFIAS
jgi:3-methylfumaryl-CoA hydratase